MLVTTSYTPSQTAEQRAARLAAELSSAYVRRGTYSLRRLGERYGESRFLLVTERELQLCDGDGQPMFFHPSLSFVRAKRLMNGEPDTLLAVSGAEPGDEVLDCTAGLGSDAIVFSLAVGENGVVTAVESEPALYVIVREGLTRYETAVESFNEAMRRVRLVNVDHLTELRQRPDRSVDIVYFDPMFRQPVEQSSAIGALRQTANHSPLKREAIEEAKRVARKRVILKEHRDSGEFERLGFPLPDRTRTKIVYGVISC